MKALAIGVLAAIVLITSGSAANAGPQRTTASDLVVAQGLSPAGPDWKWYPWTSADEYTRTLRVAAANRLRFRLDYGINDAKVCRPKMVVSRSGFNKVFYTFPPYSRPGWFYSVTRSLTTDVPGGAQLSFRVTAPGCRTRLLVRLSN